jgi:hypothetical protein
VSITQELLIIAVLVAATLVTVQGIESGTIDLRNFGRSCRRAAKPPFLAS